MRNEKMKISMEEEFIQAIPIDGDFITNLKKAALENNPSALYYLGDLYYRGHGVTKDHEIAVGYYRAATEAERTSAEAMVALGKCYAKGHGVKKDLEQADFYIREGLSRIYAECVSNGYLLDGEDMEF